MQVTRAAFQAVASLNKQATDPKSHTLVKKPLQDSSKSCYLPNSDGRPQFPATPIPCGTYVDNASGSVNSVIDTAGKIVQFEIKILNMLNIAIVPR